MIILPAMLEAWHQPGARESHANTPSQEWINSYVYLCAYDMLLRPNFQYNRASLSLRTLCLSTDDEIGPQIDFDGIPYDKERERNRLLGRDMWRSQVAEARVHADAAARGGSHVYFLDGNSHRSVSQVNTLTCMRLHSAAQTADLGLCSPRGWTEVKDRIFYGCVILPFGGGDFLVVHGVAYNKHYTCNVLVLHELCLLSEIRLVGNTIQFRNGHTYGLLPFKQAYFGGIRYTLDQFPRVKVLKIKLGIAMGRGPQVEPWSPGHPVDLGSLPVDVTLMPQHLQTSITQSGFTWQEYQQWLHRHCKDRAVGSCILAQ